MKKINNELTLLMVCCLMLEVGITLVEFQCFNQLISSLIAALGFIGVIILTIKRIFIDKDSMNKDSDE